MVAAASAGVLGFDVAADTEGTENVNVCTCHVNAKLQFPTGIDFRCNCNLCGVLVIAIS